MTSKSQIWLQGVKMTPQSQIWLQGVKMTPQSQIWVWKVKNENLTFRSQNSKSGAKNWSHFFSDLGPFFGNLGPEKTDLLHWWPEFLTKNSHFLGPESNFTPLVVLLLEGRIPGPGSWTSNSERPFNNDVVVDYGARASRRALDCVKPCFHRVM